ncbi:FAS1-like dehydratase domain-containing protein [Rhodococcus ruber]|uniref:FAS1-like dehydratase domain-containing protein n=1 Tax=Rhodococcus ruber TaxID=1830 RepID=UPI001F1D497D|nr:MaoC family dehydratase N-terminal domain-containing protein [Rhodococcus ruber]
MPPLNPNLAGRVFPPTTYLVGREKVREFARAVRATNPLHHDVEASRAAGFADVIAPTTLITVVQSPSVAQLVEPPDAGLPRLVQVL